MLIEFEYAVAAGAKILNEEGTMLDFKHYLVFTQKF